MRRYITLPFEDVTQKMIDACLETSFETLRVSKLNNTFLKWEGNKPRCLYGLQEVNIKKELQKDEWKVQDDSF